MELLAQFREDEADFMVLAREYSIDERARSGGYVGMLERLKFRDEMKAAVFGAEPGDVVGPFEIEGGFNLIKVNALYPAMLNEQREKEIRNILFKSFLAEEEKKIQVNWVV